jgi:hypothetical protein
VSLRSSLWRYLGLLAVAALAVGALAGPASAKKMSAKQRAAVRAQLKKQVKKNPKVVTRKSFIKRASLVNFKLPVTIALRGGHSASNPNKATVDLGASLGTREIDLGGSLSAELVFHDSYDGGALGNVDLSILPSNNHHLSSTSIPLLWNDQVSKAGTRYDANSLGIPSASGCGNFLGNSPVPFGAGLAASGAVGGIPQPGGLPGYPFFAAAGDTTPAGFLPVTPGVDSIDKVTAGKAVGDHDQVGGNPNPFPYSASSQPGDFTPPGPQDTVLRTNALSLDVAPAGTPVPQADNADGVSGSQNIVIGKSGGQANLFGKIPGKGYGIDVTVSLKTRINSILRVVDQDAFGSPLVTGGNYPAGIFNCRQIWTGGIDNYIPSVRLAGNLKISPGITADGKLRIAKAQVSSLPGSEARFAVAACLAPYSAYDAAQGGSDTTAPTIPSSAAVANPDGTVGSGSLPADTGTARPVPSGVPCNAPPTALVASSALGPASVSQLTPAVPADGYTVTNSGSAVTVGADLNVSGISLDVLVGDVAVN